MYIQLYSSKNEMYNAGLFSRDCFSHVKDASRARAEMPRIAQNTVSWVYNYIYG
ncbi:hypothetical protein AN958_09671 [Leucoagaricus sp. SymC.cos]|nr:hypothetical protein AN958_09671 [Leucoagaricus sp. SymC.cos]